MTNLLKNKLFNQFHRKSSIKNDTVNDQKKADR